MKKTINVNWNGQTAKLTWIKSCYPDDIGKVTSVHGFCFENDKVLLVQIKGRGINIPGGHIETMETPEEAFNREAYEEGYVRGSIKYLGMLEVSHEENPNFDPSGKYPLIGYQLFYRMDILERLPFLGENESNTRIWVETSEVPYIIDDHELVMDILDEALRNK
jgi:8-oxo-dGTP diphosphatase